MTSGAWSRAPPVTSAGGSRRACSTRGTRSAVWSATRQAARRAVGSRVEVARGDVLDPSTPPARCEGVDVAYYLVHSLGEP